MSVSICILLIGGGVCDLGGGVTSSSATARLGWPSITACTRQSYSASASSAGMTSTSRTCGRFCLGFYLPSYAYSYAVKLNLVYISVSVQHLSDQQPALLPLGGSSHMIVAGHDQLVLANSLTTCGAVVPTTLKTASFGSSEILPSSFASCKPRRIINDRWWRHIGRWRGQRFDVDRRGCTLLPPLHTVSTSVAGWSQVFSKSVFPKTMTATFNLDSRHICLSLYLTLWIVA